MYFNIAKLQTTVPRRETLPCCKNPLFFYQSTTTDMLIPEGKKKRKKVRNTQKILVSVSTQSKFSSVLLLTCLLVKSGRLTACGNFSLSLCSTVSTLNSNITLQKFTPMCKNQKERQIQLLCSFSGFKAECVIRHLI